MQKKLPFFLAAILCATVSSKAQISKENIVLGGNFSFSNTNSGSSTPNITKFTISPSLGKVYKENRIAGFNLNYQYQGNSVDHDLNTSSYGAGIYLAQYKPLGKNFYILIRESLNGNFGHLRYNTIYNSNPAIQDDKNFSLSLTINPGVAYDLNKKIQLELLFLNNLISAGYTTTKSTTEFNTGSFYLKQNNFYATSNSNLAEIASLNIGAKIFFGRR